LKTALVTGATGFIGSHLCKALVKASWNVHVLTRGNSKLAVAGGQIQHHQIGSKPLREIWNALPPVKAIFHLATEYGRGSTPVYETISTNLLFPIELLELGAKGSKPLFIATDTCYQTSYPYLRPYTLSKKQFADWGRIVSEEFGCKFVNLVLQHPYGPGDGEGKFVPWIVNACLKNQDKIDLTEGLQKKDFVFVSDVVDAFLCLAEQAHRLENGFSEFECGTGSAVSIREFVQMVHLSLIHISEPTRPY